MKIGLFLTFLLPVLSFAEEFAQPMMLKAGGAPIQVEAPGYACPSWADWDGDGKKDLLVGQFSQGKIHFFKNEGNDSAPQFKKGEFLLTGNKPAEVPGVW